MVRTRRQYEKAGDGEISPVVASSNPENIMHHREQDIEEVDDAASIRNRAAANAARAAQEPPAESSASNSRARAARKKGIAKKVPTKKKSAAKSTGKTGGRKGKAKATAVAGEDPEQPSSEAVATAAEPAEVQDTHAENEAGGAADAAAETTEILEQPGHETVATTSEPAELRDVNVEGEAAVESPALAEVHQDQNPEEHTNADQPAALASTRDQSPAPATTSPSSAQTSGNAPAPINTDLTEDSESAPVSGALFVTPVSPEVSPNMPQGEAPPEDSAPEVSHSDVGISAFQERYAREQGLPVSDMAADSSAGGSGDQPAVDDSAPPTGTASTQWTERPRADSRDEEADDSRRKKSGSEATTTGSRRQSQSYSSPCDEYAARLRDISREPSDELPTLQSPVTMGESLLDETLHRAIASVAEAISRLDQGVQFSLLPPSGINALGFSDVPGTPPQQIKPSQQVARAGNPALIPYSMDSHHSLFVVDRRHGPDYVVDRYDSANSSGHTVNFDRHNDQIKKYLRELGWIPHESSLTIPETFNERANRIRQNNRWECGIHTIFNAWAVALGLNVASGKTASKTRNPAAFLRDGIAIINLALRGQMDSNTIEAFLKCFGFVARNEMVPDDRVFERTVAFPDIGTLNHTIDRLRVAEDLDFLRQSDPTVPSIEETEHLLRTNGIDGAFTFQNSTEDVLKAAGIATTAKLPAKADTTVQGGTNATVSDADAAVNPGDHEPGLEDLVSAALEEQTHDDTRDNNTSTPGDVENEEVTLQTSANEVDGEEHSRSPIAPVSNGEEHVDEPGTSSGAVNVSQDAAPMTPDNAERVSRPEDESVNTMLQGTRDIVDFVKRHEHILHRNPEAVSSPAQTHQSAGGLHLPGSSTDSVSPSENDPLARASSESPPPQQVADDAGVTQASSSRSTLIDVISGQRIPTPTPGSRSPTPAGVETTVLESTEIPDPLDQEEQRSGAYDRNPLTTTNQIPEDDRLGSDDDLFGEDGEGEDEYEPPVPPTPVGLALPPLNQVTSVPGLRPVGSGLALPPIQQASAPSLAGAVHPREDDADDEEEEATKPRPSKRPRWKEDLEAQAEGEKEESDDDRNHGDGGALAALLRSQGYTVEEEDEEKDPYAD